VGKRLFGVSTRLYERERLNREHLREVASYGFDTVEVHAVRTHVDFENPAVVADLQQWLAEARLDLHALRVPIGAADDEAEQALYVARRLPMPVLTLQIARPKEAARAIDRLTELAAPLGVTIAVDSASEGLAPIGSLVHFVEGFEPPVGIALDFGRAHRDGDLVEAIEIASEHLVSARLPIDGGIDWPAALTAVQKVGYEGALLLDLPRGAPKVLLRQARQARERFERLLCTSI
jgi:sugar phosphate isomerase/epimerase